jgi:hypothetical protein
MHHYQAVRLYECIEEKNIVFVVVLGSYCTYSQISMDVNIRTCWSKVVLKKMFYLIHPSTQHITVTIPPS